MKQAAPEEGQGGFITGPSFTETAPCGAVFTSVQPIRLRATETRPGADSGGNWGWLATFCKAPTDVSPCPRRTRRPDRRGTHTPMTGEPEWCNLNSRTTRCFPKKATNTELHVRRGSLLIVPASRSAQTLHIFDPDDNSAGGAVAADAAATRRHNP